MDQEQGFWMILEHVGKCWKRMENDGKFMNPKGVKMIEHDGNDGK